VQETGVRQGTLLTPAKKATTIRPIFVVLLVVAAAVIFWLWRSATSDRSAPPSAGLLTAA
jgi:uncharacterized membrane protein YhhN